MSWQEWGLKEWWGLGLAAIGGYSICIALALTLRKWLIEHMQNRERQLQAKAQSFDWAQSQAQRLRQIEAAAANAAGPLADVDAYFARVDSEVKAEAARIAQREVRR